MFCCYCCNLYNCFMSMTRAECISKGCLFLGKKHNNNISYIHGIVSMNDTYICWKCGKELKKVKECPNKK